MLLRYHCHRVQTHLQININDDDDDDDDDDDNNNNNTNHARTHCSFLLISYTSKQNFSSQEYFIGRLNFGHSSESVKPATNL
jgi:hypothetical protein